jgi:lipid-A-disaccharide synthase
MSDVFIVTGEMSGDLLGSSLIKALKNQNLEITGVFGPKMRAEIPSCFMEMEEFQVMGFVDVVKHLPSLMSNFFKIRDEILRTSPKVVVTIDYPDFNLRLLKSLKNHGFQGKLCHYVCPSVWAWRASRIKTIESCVDQLLCLLPFEEKLFSTGIATYIGHPLMSEILMRENPKNLVALFPGSRRKEIERNLPLQLKAFKKLQGEYPDLKATVSVAHVKYLSLIKEMTDLPLSFEPQELMKSASLAIAKSGTVTLELALFGVPTVVTYEISALDYFVAKHLLRIKLTHYSLPNIIAGTEIFPEHIGHHLSSEAVAASLKKIFKSPETLNQLKILRETLGNHNPSERAASLILSLVSE